MKHERAAAMLALVEASRALELAHRSLVRLGDTERASEVSDMGEDVASLIGELSTGRNQLPVEVVS